MEEFTTFRQISGAYGIDVLVVPAVICALVYWIRYCHAGESLAKSVIKTASVLLLAAAAWVPWGAGSLILALGFCGLGDYFLSRDGERAFLAGVTAFAAGHLAYVHLFLTHRLARPEVLLSPPQIYLIGILAAIGGVMGVVLWRRAEALRWAVLAYIPIILAMAVTVMVLPGSGPLKFAFPAAVLFLLSDVTLAFQVFVFHPEGKAARIGPFAVWPTYWLAQFGFYLAFAGVAMK